MAVFADGLDSWQRLDYQILRDGGISIYRSVKYLDEDVSWLLAKGYNVENFDCSAWETVEMMHEDLQRKLCFPDYYGRNLDALNDCLRSDLVIPEDGGLVVVFRRLDIFVHGADALRAAAEGMLDIFAGAAREALLRGRRLIAIIQSENPGLSFGPLGAVHALWNKREWNQPRNPS
jgi:RNAse (barnase) inhibitor barstar